MPLVAGQFTCRSVAFGGGALEPRAGTVAFERHVQSHSGICHWPSCSDWQDSPQMFPRDLGKEEAGGMLGKRAVQCGCSCARSIFTSPF